MELEGAGHAAKAKLAAELGEQLHSAKAGLDRMAKSARAASAREEVLLAAKAQGDLAIEQVGPVNEHVRALMLHNTMGGGEGVASSSVCFPYRCPSPRYLPGLDKPAVSVVVLVVVMLVLLAL